MRPSASLKYSIFPIAQVITIMRLPCGIYRKLAKNDSFWYILVMVSRLDELLRSWKHPVITSSDLSATFSSAGDRKHSAVKRALKSKILIRLKRGIYLVGQPYNQRAPDPFTIFSRLYGPSFISFESALSYHNWIPEAVYSTTCACPKRAKEYQTPIGRFVFYRVPQSNFYRGVRRVSNGSEAFLIANPWRALADLAYHRHCSWETVLALNEDLRIDLEALEDSDLDLLRNLSQEYPSQRVRAMLTKLHEELV